MDERMRSALAWAAEYAASRGAYASSERERMQRALDFLRKASAQLMTRVYDDAGAAVKQVFGGRADLAAVHMEGGQAGRYGGLQGTRSSSERRRAQETAAEAVAPLLHGIDRLQRREERLRLIGERGPADSLEASQVVYERTLLIWDEKTSREAFTRMQEALSEGLDT